MAVDFNEGSLINNRYRILGDLGEGGMSQVYKAQDTLLERTVALKVLRPQYSADASFLARFRREAQAAARLAHPNIVDVYDISEVDGWHFIVMEYVEGQDLKNIIAAESPLPIRRVVDMGIQICSAVGLAHQLGIVHRDLKPHNILVMADDRVKVTDFGIARAIAEASATVTTEGAVWGTVQYIAPEQASGQPATPASDVYSLGIVLYEMLAGRLPFEADSRVALAVKHIQDEPPPLHSFNPYVPAKMEAIVAQAMVKDPNQRYPNADVLGQALREYRRTGEAATGPLPRIVPAAKPVQQVITPPAAPPRAVERRVPARSLTRPASPATTIAPTAGVDYVALMLGLLAAVAVLGLIPLWLAVLQRLTPSPAQPTVRPTPVVQQKATNVEVPDVKRLSREEAQSKLENQGLKLKLQDERFDDAMPAHFVLEQSPPPGTRVSEGTAVAITLSRGPNFIQVPSVVNQPLGTAVAILESNGLVATREIVWSSSAPAGIVVEQDPGFGAAVIRSTQVTLIVSSGRRIDVGAVLGNLVRLTEVELDRVEVRANDHLQINLFWEVLRPFTRNYTVFVHLARPSDGQPVAQHDSPPQGGKRPTTGWQSGETIIDAHELVIPNGVRPGSYELRIGFYAPDLPVAEQRLPVTSPGNATVALNSVVVRRIEVR